MHKTIWTAVSASLSFFLWGMMGVSIGALLPNAMKEFSLSPMLAGLIFVVWSTGFMCGSFVAERLLRFKAPLTVLTALSCLTAVLSLTQFMVGQALWFLLVYALLGACGGSIFTASHTLFGNMFAERRSSALAILDVVFSFGNMMAPLVIIALLSLGFGWRNFYALLGVGFLVISTCFFTIDKLRLGHDGSFGSEAEVQGPGLKTIPRSTVASVAIACFFLGAVEWTQNVWSVTFLIERGVGSDLARLGLSTFTAGMIACRLMVIWFVKSGRSPATVGCIYAAALLGELLIVTSRGVALPLVGNAILGFGIGGLFPIFLGRAMDRFPTISATMSMLMIVSLTLGGQVASFALGALAQDLGITVAFLVIVPAVGAMVVAFELVRRQTTARPERAAAASVSP